MTVTSLLLCIAMALAMTLRHVIFTRVLSRNKWSPATGGPPPNCPFPLKLVTDSPPCTSTVCLCICFLLQTWDLLRILVYGFRGLISDFLSSHPGYHVNPRRLNGSGVKTLFGQLKHTTGGNLTGHSYETAKATLLTQRSVHGRKTKDDYRDTPLNMRQAELRRK